MLSGVSQPRKARVGLWEVAQQEGCCLQAVFGLLVTRNCRPARAVS